MSAQPSHQQGSCGPTCTYRRLYEGSQSSLADMAARQAEAHARLNRFKAGVVEICKRVFPRPFTQAETALGQRLTTVGDEILLAYLSSFCSDLAVNSAAPAAGLDELRSALSQIGVPLPLNGDLAAWAGAVRTAASAGLLNVPFDPSALPQPLAAEKPFTAPTVASEPVPVAQPAPDAELDDAGSLFSDLFGSPEEHRPSDISNTLDDERFLADVLVADVPDDEVDLADLFDDVWTSAPARQSPVPTHVNGPAVDDAASTSPVGAEPARQAAADPTEDPFDGLPGFADDPAPTMPLAPPADAPLPPLSPSTGTGTGTGTGKDDSREHGTVAEQRSFGGPMKLIATPPPTTKAPRKRTARTPRVSAVAPDPLPFDVAVPGAHPASAAAQDPAVTASAVQAVLQPRPVFLFDIAAVLGSEAAAAAWEESERASNDASVWFIAPSGRGARARNAARGNLVVPHEHAAATPFTGSRWAECSTTFRGRPLYELAVLMREFDDEIVSVDVGKEVVMLRLSTNAGIVAIVVSMSTRVEKGSAGRAALADAVGTLLRERSSRIAVLTVHESNLDPIVQALEEERVARGWQPATTVVAARAWDYAARSPQAVQAIFS